MSATAEMPYYIRPSLSFSNDQKEDSYARIRDELKALLTDEDNLILKMSTMNCIFKTHLPYFYWVGFYMYRNDRLEVGPYQGTLGCLHIALGKGVCGRAALKRETIIVDDCHMLIEGSEHIACDPNSRSEIVLPVVGRGDELIAVLDVDSTLPSSFNEIDHKWLELILEDHFG